MLVSYLACAGERVRLVHGGGRDCLGIDNRLSIVLPFRPDSTTSRQRCQMDWQGSCISFSVGIALWADLPAMKPLRYQVDRTTEQRPMILGLQGRFAVLQPASTEWQLECSLSPDRVFWSDTMRARACLELLRYSGTWPRGSTSASTAPARRCSKFRLLPGLWLRLRPGPRISGRICPTGRRARPSASR